MCEDRVMFVSVDLHVSLCWQQHPKRETANRMVCRPSFGKRPSSSDTINKNLTELGPDNLVANEQLSHGNHPEVDTGSS